MTTAIEVKIMPEAVDTNIEEIKKEIPERIPEAKSIKIEEQEIAFGLKALILHLAWPENQDTDQIENNLLKIKGVSSCQITDIRRAFG